MEHTKFEIPILEWPSNAGGYSSIPIDLGDSRSLDPLVPVEELAIASESFYYRNDGRNWPYNCRINGSLSRVWCRKLVATKLVEANKMLREHDAEVFVWDGYRSIETQLGLWSFYWEKSRQKMPGATAEQLRSDVLPYVSDPMKFDRSDPTTWPVHTTGGAIDLTLRNLKTHELLDMGAQFDEMDPVSHSDAYERLFKKGEISQAAAPLRNRRLLHWAMSCVNLINYPFEFWHFDWGDQMYVRNLQIMATSGPHAAWYGYVDPPS